MFLEEVSQQKRIIDDTFEKYKDLKVDHIEESLEPISRLAYDSYVGSNNAVLQKVVRDMRIELKNQHTKYNISEMEDIF